MSSARGATAAVAVIPALLLLLLSLSAVSANLVAYYPFDCAFRILPLLLTLSLIYDVIPSPSSASNVGIPGSCFTNVPSTFRRGALSRV